MWKPLHSAVANNFSQDTVSKHLQITDAMISSTSAAIPIAIGHKPGTFGRITNGGWSPPFRERLKTGMYCPLFDGLPGARRKDWLKRLQVEDIIPQNSLREWAREARKSGPKKQKGRADCSGRGLLNFNPGDDLRSHTVARAVSSAQRGLTSVFGMGTGVTLAV